MTESLQTFSKTLATEKTLWGKEIFYLMTLNTFYLRLYGIRHMVKDRSDSERGNLLLPHKLLFPISSKGYFICITPDRIIHTTAFVMPVVEHWLEWEIAQWIHPMKDRSDYPSHHEQTFLPQSYITLQTLWVSVHYKKYTVRTNVHK